ncbi:MAG: nuclear transport factor 2 family protein [Pseudomonadota bacterium]
MEAESTIRALNDAWLQRRWDDLAAYFDEQVVMLMPFGDEKLEGREAMMASYREFVDAATDIQLTINSIDTQDYGPTAVCHMSFEVDFTLDGEREKSEGLEVYVLHADPGQPPRVVWRTQRVHSEAPVIALEA